MREWETRRSCIRVLCVAMSIATLPAVQASAACAILNASADGWSKEEASGAARAALQETIASWKTKNAITSAISETPQKPEPRPYWRTTVSPDLLLTPDIVTSSDYTVCWKGVISKAVCTSGTKLCW
jgi:hypothetical protein